MSTSGPSALPHADSDVFGQYGPGVTCASAVILMLAISAIDKLTGFDLRIGILQLIPVAVMTWAAGRTWGIALSIAAVAVWLLNFRGHHSDAASFYFYWEAAILFGTLIVFALLLGRLREELDLSNERLVQALEELDAAVYVADPQGAVLFGNRHFRETLAGQPAEQLRILQAKECALRWPDGRRVILRVVTEAAK
jgi:PAS domain-containing protein